MITRANAPLPWLLNTPPINCHISKCSLKFTPAPLWPPHSKYAYAVFNAIHGRPHVNGAILVFSKILPIFVVMHYCVRRRFERTIWEAHCIPVKRGWLVAGENCYWNSCKYQTENYKNYNIFLLGSGAYRILEFIIRRIIVFYTQ